MDPGNASAPGGTGAAQESDTHRQSSAADATTPHPGERLPRGEHPHFAVVNRRPPVFVVVAPAGQLRPGGIAFVRRKHKPGFVLTFIGQVVEAAPGWEVGTITRRLGAPGDGR